MQQLFKFSRQLRLLNPNDFKTVFEQVDFKVSAQPVLLLARNNNHSSCRLGFILAKKNIKLAVQRNRVRRVVRNYFRLRQHEMPALDVVFMARKGIDQLTNQQLYSLVDKQFNRLKKHATNKK